MPTRKVLTVNQCFEILVKWVETRNWEEALYSVIPQRKFQGAGPSTTPGPVVVAGAVVVPVEEEGEESDGQEAEAPPEKRGDEGHGEKES
jgi:tRNA (guanine9-N1)-methyltransferase